mgnify:CR=1 FL=1
MKYDARACHFNMDTGCVELLLRDGRMISIDCTGVEDALDVTMAQRSELDYLIYNDPLSYADLILNGDPEEYLKNMFGSHRLEDRSFRDQLDIRNKPTGLPYFICGLSCGLVCYYRLMIEFEISSTTVSCL